MTHTTLRVALALFTLAAATGCSLQPRTTHTSTGLQQLIAEDRDPASSRSMERAELNAPMDAGPQSQPKAAAEVTPAPASAPVHGRPAAMLARPKVLRLATTADAPAAAADAVKKVAVLFRPADAEKKYEVTALLANGAPLQDTKCEMPCTLQLPPGKVLLAFSGDGSYAQEIDVPAAGGAMNVDLASSGRKLAAGILLGTGGVIAAVGFALIPVLGGVPLLIMGGSGLVLLLTGLILNATADDRVEWAPAAGGSSAPAASAPPEQTPPAFLADAPQS